MPSDNTHDSRDRRDTTEKRAGTHVVLPCLREDATVQTRGTAKQKSNGPSSSRPTRATALDNNNIRRTRTHIRVDEDSETQLVHY